MDTDIHERDDEGRTPLHFAAEEGDTAEVIALIRAGADPDAKDNWDGAPLHVAALLGFMDIVTALIKAGADLEAKDRLGLTALHLQWRKTAAYEETFNAAAYVPKS